MTSIIASFNSPMRNNELLVDPANYVAAGPTATYVSAVEVISNYQVRLTLGHVLREGAVYTMTISNVENIWREVIAPPDDVEEFIGMGLNTPAQYDFDTVTNYPAGLPDGDTDSIDVATPSSGDIIIEGELVKVTLIDYDSVGSGDVRVQIYNDKVRSECIFDQYFDLANLPLTSVIPAHFFSDGVDGESAIYADITNNTGSTARFQVAARMAIIQTGTLVGGGVGTGVGVDNARDGIGWDGTGLYVDTLTGGGLALTGITPDKKLGVAAGTGILVGATVALDPAVANLLNTIQTNTAMKRFASGTIGLAPHGSTIGPPTAGTWQAGDLFVDYLVMTWRCRVGGSPGTWQFFGSAIIEEIDGQISAGEDNATYTSTIACAATLDLTISVLANTGFIQKLCIWATQSAWPTGDLDQPFRVICYPNSNRRGREQLWCQPGQFRKVSIANTVTGGMDNVVQVTDVDIGAEDDLVRLRKLSGTDAEEYARIKTRDTSAMSFTMKEDVLNTFQLNDPMMFVTEIVMMPFINNDPIYPRKLFLSICNDGRVADGDVTIIAGYQMNLQYLGGGASY